MKRPNILIIYTDQQRWDALGANGNPDIQTPNLDRLARQGVNFDHYFVQNPVCMPSRVSFLTGQYPSTLGITHMGVPVPEETITLPKLLRNYGYRSANIGKLHFLPHANRDHRTTHPDYGFDHLEIADEPGPYEDAYRAWVRRKKPDQLDKISAGLPPTAAIWYQTMRVEDTVVHPTVNETEGGGRFDFKGAIPFAGDDDVTYSAFVAEQTIDYLEAQSADQPFLCISSFYSPHSPWIAPQRYLDMYDPQNLTLPSYPSDVEDRRPADGTADELYSDAQLRSAHHGYYAMVTEVDHYVGQILDKLDELGLADNTAVVFTSDHGEWLGEHLRYGKGYPGHDCVSRVPLLVRMPTGDPTALSGIRCEEIVEGVDVIPTLLDCAGIQIPPHLQGRSLFPVLTAHKAGAQGATVSTGDKSAGNKSTVDQSAVDQSASDNNALLDSKPALMEFTGWKMLRSTEYRYVIHGDGREFLYDLNQPLGDYMDVAGEPAYGNALAHMRHQMLQRMVAIERPLPKSWTY